MTDAIAFDLTKIIIRSGNHSAPSQKKLLEDPSQVQACVMEWVFLADALDRGLSVKEIVAGWTDRPPCSSPAITSMMIRFNDRVTDDTRRTRVLSQVIGCVRKSGGGSDALEHRRRWAAADWALRVASPRLLRLANLGEHAAALEAVTEIRSYGELAAARTVTSAAWNAAAGLRRRNYERLYAMLRERLPKAEAAAAAEEAAAAAAEEAAEEAAAEAAAAAAAAEAAAAAAAAAEAAAAAASEEDLARIVRAAAETYEKTKDHWKARTAAYTVAREIFRAKLPSVRPKFVALGEELDAEFVVLVQRLCAMREEDAAS